MYYSKYLLLFLCLWCMLSSCGENNEKVQVLMANGKLLEIVKAIAKSDNQMKSEDFFTDVKITLLETNDSILIDAGKKIIYHQGEYFIADSKSNVLFVFDQNGRFTRKIGQKGSGPVEYHSLGDFEIDIQTEELILYSPRDLNLFVYTIEGEFKKRQKLEFFGSSFELLGNDKYAFYTNYNES